MCTSNTQDYTNSSIFTSTQSNICQTARTLRKIFFAMLSQGGGELLPSNPLVFSYIELIHVDCDDSGRKVSILPGPLHIRLESGETRLLVHKGNMSF